MEKFKIEKYDGFFEAILKLKTTEDCRKFFEDVCTIKELEDISQRLEVAALLKDGNNYQEVSKKTGASTATISRVNKCINYGSGGYNIVLKGEKD
ncbi:MAG: TrpR-like protein YerC/YecD [Clostridiales bacterium]|nr:TrpR-like protein YerC/YecD [Clostridiales bacterium]MBQ3046757.1 TrpR-like protein YerC/YecD [Clostridia bacterium]